MYAQSNKVMNEMFYIYIYIYTHTHIYTHIRSAKCLESRVHLTLRACLSSDQLHLSCLRLLYWRVQPGWQDNGTNLGDPSAKEHLAYDSFQNE